MSFEHLFSMLRDFGFPVAVALWFMLRLEKRIDRQVELLNSLMQATAVLAKAVDSLEPPPRATTLSIEERTGS